MGSADAAPTATQAAAAEKILAQLNQLLGQWNTIKGK
jgi:hypothetical protein